MKYALALLSLALVLPAVAVASPTVAPRNYMLPAGIEASIQEYGLTWNHRRHAVLSATCDGQGLRGPKRRDEWGFMSPTYHLFLCMVTVRRVPNVDLIHVEVRRDGSWAWEQVN